jgi:hypothetical protein
MVYVTISFMIFFLYLFGTSGEFNSKSIPEKNSLSDLLQIVNISLLFLNGGSRALGRWIKNALNILRICKILRELDISGVYVPQLLDPEAESARIKAYVSMQ